MEGTLLSPINSCSNFRDIVPVTLILKRINGSDKIESKNSNTIMTVILWIPLDGAGLLARSFLVVCSSQMIG